MPRPERRLSLTPGALWTQGDIILKVRAPEHHPGLGVDEVELLREGHTLTSFVWPEQNEDLM